MVYEDRAEANIRIRCSRAPTTIEHIYFRMYYIESTFGNRAALEGPYDAISRGKVLVWEKFEKAQLVPRALPLQVKAGTTRYFRVEFVGVHPLYNSDYISKGRFDIRKIRNCFLFVETTQRTLKFRPSQCAFRSVEYHVTEWTRDWKTLPWEGRVDGQGHDPSLQEY